MGAAFSPFGFLETDIECIYNTLYELLNKIVPRRACQLQEDIHWWTPEMSSMREELKHLLAHKIRGISLLWQGDTFAISVEESLDFILKQHIPMHLPS